MKKLFSVAQTPALVTAAILVLRIGIGLTMIGHGYSKLTTFAEKQDNFMSFMGLSSAVSLGLVVFAEFFCSIGLMLGVFTRLACIPLIITMVVALFKAHSGDVFGKGEASAMYLVCFIVILLLGPGPISIDAALNKWAFKNKATLPATAA